ncbi:MAG: DUF262 domain-containing protein [Synergistaceae bacterium]|nr:DUF262 domain-containing protein [Synergistaceae bacterium]
MYAQKSNINEMLNGVKQFIIPIYQRFYSWDIEQCRRLWNDIVSMQENNKDYHFIGSIVNIVEHAASTGVQKYIIIDGQQRITTLLLLLIALRDYAIQNPDEKAVNSRKIDNTLLKNEYEDGSDRYKLLLTESDREIFISLVENKPITQGTKSRLLDNYNFFAKKINDKILQPAEIFESISKLQIVNITLERSLDDAQAIFESLNSTGKELSESDLIRNYLLMGLDNNEQIYIYEQYWRPMEKLFGNQILEMDQFFRDYITLKINVIPNKNLTYEEFKKYSMNSEFDSTRDLCADLYKYANYYNEIMFSRSNNPEINNLYNDIVELKMTVSYPFLMRLINDYHEKIINESEFKQVLRLCISYVFRRSICDFPTNSLNKTFANMKNAINSIDYVNSIKAFFLMCGGYREFPDNDRFIAAFTSRDIYNMQNRVKFILRSLENFDNKAPINMANYTVEHIMPQTLTQEWQKMLGDNWRDVQKKYLHTIGNLTLTAYNSEMSNSSFTEKMNITGGFKQSALRLNNFLVTLDEWNESNIINRANLLAEKAVKIWEFPSLTPEELAKYKGQEERYSIASYNTNNYTMELFNLLDSRIKNISSYVRREFKKLYVAYKLDTNFADIFFQSQRLKISINMKFADVNDPEGICRDVTGLGKWGNGDVEVYMEKLSDIDNVMYIIMQSYNYQQD